MRENRTYGSEGGEGGSSSLPLSFHRGDKLRVRFRRDYPANLAPRFDFVFFSTRRTVS